MNYIFNSSLWWFVSVLALQQTKERVRTDGVYASNYIVFVLKCINLFTSSIERVALFWPSTKFGTTWHDLIKFSPSKKDSRFINTPIPVLCKTRAHSNTSSDDDTVYLRYTSSTRKMLYAIMFQFLCLPLPNRSFILPHSLILHFATFD